MTVISKLAILVSFAALASACMTPGTSLSEGGAKVKIRSTLTKEEKEAFEQVGTFRCDAGANGKVTPANLQACENDLRNRSSLHGADVITISEESANGVSTWEGRCNNCVALIGIFYKKKDEGEQKKEELQLTGLEWKDKEGDESDAPVEKKKPAKKLSAAEQKKQKEADDEMSLLLNAQFSGPGVPGVPGVPASAVAGVPSGAPSMPSVGERAPSAREPGSTEASDKSPEKPKKKKLKKPKAKK